MVNSWFTADGRPYLEASLSLPRLGVEGAVNFLIDTGASADIILHIQDARRLSIPLDRLRDRVAARGIGGSRDYFEEQGILVFDESDETEYGVTVKIAGPEPADALPSLLGDQFSSSSR